ncbi:HhH-GPD family protein [Neocallimastix sp. 'constans']|jgi:endonuclease-3 related protein
MPKISKKKSCKLTPKEIYDKLKDEFGDPPWWPGDSYIVMVQSILVQNTTWSSVEKITTSLKKMTPRDVLKMKIEKLEDLIRPCGFCKRKAKTIKYLTEWYGKYKYNVESVMKIGKTELRKELLAIKGIGPETADVILVYVFHKPSFVIDAYTRRLLERLGFSFKDDSEIRSFFEKGIEKDYKIYGWYHWLILRQGIEYCKKKPSCENCPFYDICKRKI